MRFLHTADWHLGRLFHGASLVDDQARLLDQLVDVARDARPDVVLVAGDVYDRAVPPPDAVAVLDDVLSRLVIELKLPVLKTGDINAEALPAADLLVVIAFGQKIGEHVVSAPRLGAVNLHASRLPRYRGAAPINWAILAGETVAGNSVIRLASKMDAGAVLGMSELPIGELETAGELHDRLSQDGVGLMLRVIDDLAAGRAVEREQDHAQATLAPKLSRQSAVLDFAKPSAELARQIRGLHPWPGCRAKVLSAEGKPADSIRLVRARGHATVPGAAIPPGTISEDGRVGTGNGALELVEVQPDGKRPMSLADYRRGHAWHGGMRLEAVG